MDIQNKQKLITILKIYPKLDLIIEQRNLLSHISGFNPIDLLAFIQKTINRVLNLSSDEVQKIIQSKFFHHDSVSTVSLSMRLHISRTTVYNRINDFLNYIFSIIHSSILNRTLYILSYLDYS